MARDLRRFERLEKARSEEPERPAASVRERFGEQPASAAPADPPVEPEVSANLEPSTGLAVEAPEAPDAQPFVRCAYCEADSGKFATACQNCGKPLDTPEQRAFNARLWNERRAQAQVDEQELERQHEEMRQQQEQQQQAQAAAQRTLGVSLAQMERTLEEERLGRRGLLDGGGSVGIRLLELIPDARARLGVLVGLVALGGFGLYHWVKYPYEHFSPWHLVVVGLCLLFIPFGVTSWRRDRWW